MFKMFAILIAVKNEVVRAKDLHGNFSSPHEGYGVLLEEVDELWDEVKNNTVKSANCKQEAIQVAAMAVRFALDLCE